MKHVVLALLVAFIGSQLFAQERGGFQKKPSTGKHYRSMNQNCPVFYFNLSAGFNNNTGIIGINFDKPVAKFVSVEAGLGISSWGYKFYGGGKYYFRPCHRGWAIGSGFTYNTGIRNYQNKMETIYGKEDVELNLQPQINVLAAAYRYWSVGRNANRLYLELGWSVPLSSGVKFVQTYGDPLSAKTADRVNFRSPGGLIVGFGFSFAKY